MIGKLKGLVDSYGDDHVILDVQGVGYLVHCSARTLQALPPVGEAATLFIEMLVREDMIRLYGFVSQAEKSWFLLLQNVQGVGSKVALNVLSTLSPSELANAVALGDKVMVARANGVGPKVAARIVAELKDKAPGFASVDPGVAGLVAQIEDRQAPRPVADAVSALVNLGYAPIQASAAIAGAVREAGEDADTARLIRLGLKELAK
ncbi:Holliday junction branch migration protein RuvA [Ancylobacter aquaticus]|nr:Holliday junction branch migration protein RuvA [Ancylobacter aquaticus]